MNLESIPFTLRCGSFVYGETLVTSWRENILALCVFCLHTEHMAWPIPKSLMLIAININKWIYLLQVLQKNMGDKSFDSQLAQAGLSTLAKRVRNPSMGSSVVPLADNLTNSGCCLPSSVWWWCKFDDLISEVESSAIVSCCRCFSDDSAMTDVLDVLRMAEPIYGSKYVFNQLSAKARI